MSERLSLERRTTFHRTEWLIQRFGWTIWFVILASAALGLIGPGPMSRAVQVASDDSLRIQYQRFEHYGHPTSVQIEVRDLPRDTERVLLSMNQDFLQALKIEAIHPEPLESKLDKDATVFEFSVEPGAESVAIKFVFEVEEFGRSTGIVGLVGHKPVTFQQFIYP